MAWSKLEAMAIYVVNQACGNDIRAGVYKSAKDQFTELQAIQFLLRNNKMLGLQNFHFLNIESCSHLN